ncbi:VRR-NUC domain-containing protein [Ochrobactrum chromiisoli]|uniref:VRR-NUC domain-containing protein n=1 Tax=Ochrobactrum chromiisoli TaxID=2993941 RepID=A0ABT3QM64_9HYPH|nr:VRR-NUC domain-containing protein [Ochrobactrum chromiisoli]MCX2696702.1 VRR-NUC domain-containing protein [Ochrobactrum chromiisoli]
MTRRRALKSAPSNKLSSSKPNSKSARSATKATTQTVRINGVRTIITTRNGKVTTKAAPPLEWELQAAQVRALRRLPEHVHTARDVRPGTFTLAGDQNAAKRGPKARAEALAAGLTPGEADVRIYLYGGVLRQIENKVGKAKLEPSQITRHPLLDALGFPVVVVRAVNEDDAAEQAVRLVKGWLLESANDNQPKTHEEAA